MKLSELNEFVRNKNYNDETELCRIMKECGSDKSSDWHNYTALYSKLFDAYKSNTINFFELGILFGSSIRGWCKYFQNANIFAADIDPSYLINDERVKSYTCNQDNKQSIEALWKNFNCNEFFDLIIEDGKHEFESNLTFLRSSIHMLKKGGVFVIEDLTHETRHLFSNICDNLKNELNVEEILILDIPNANNNIDNCLLLIRK